MLSPLGDCSWRGAREYAHALPKRMHKVSLALGEASGFVLAEDLVALADVPTIDASAMDGWAISGDGPWQISGSVATGAPTGVHLNIGTAVRINTGGCVPMGTTAVLRSEHGIEHEDMVSLSVDGIRPAQGQYVRPRAEEFARGEVVVAAGTRLDPITVAMAATCGLDDVRAYAKPEIDLVVTGGEVDPSGPPALGRVRDAFTPQFAALCASVGAQGGACHRVDDELESLVDALRECAAPIVLTTGGTAGGSTDRIRDALRELRATILIDQLDVRPGRPTMLAKLPGGRFIVSLAGNPLAALVGFITVAQPLVAGMTGAGLPAVRRIRLAAPVGAQTPAAMPADLVLPFAWDGAAAMPSQWTGAAMLRGLAAADGFLIVAPGCGAAGDEVSALPLAWRS